jgi:hypothetical protein
MLRVGFVSPANLWRAFFVFFLPLAAIFAAPPPSAPPALAQVGKPNAEESARILDQFRRSGWHGYVEFDLRALPRAGDEVVYHGKLWGGQTEQGAITRIEVTDGAGTVHRFLLQNGEHPLIWAVRNGAVVQIAGDAMFQPLIPGVEITPFDLQMPYLYWPGANVESIARVRGRPAYVFAFMPPPGFPAGNPPLKLVHADFDAQFNAPVQIELVSSRQVLKTMSLVDLKKIGEQWIPRSFDLRNDLTRDKTRFEVTAVALNLDFADAVFAPAQLTESVRPPAADRIVRLDR